MKRDDLWTNIDEFKAFNNRMELKVTFDGEVSDQSADAGGLSKEWFTLLSQEILKKETLMFKRCETEEMAYFIEEQSEELIDCE